MRLGLREQNGSKYVRQKGHDIHCSPHLARDVATLPGHDRNWQNSGMYISSSTWWMIANPWQQYPSRRWHAPACIGSTQARKLKLCKALHVSCVGWEGKSEPWRGRSHCTQVICLAMKTRHEKIWKASKSLQGTRNLKTMHGAVQKLRKLRSSWLSMRLSEYTYLAKADRTCLGLPLDPKAVHPLPLASSSPKTKSFFNQSSQGWYGRRPSYLRRQAAWLCDRLNLRFGSSWHLQVSLN